MRDDRLHQAAWERRVDDIRRLLDAGVDINGSDDHGCTPLHLAIENGGNEAAILLLQRGADVHARDGDARTPLHTAAMNGNTLMVQLLIKQGAHVRARDCEGETPLEVAQQISKQFLKLDITDEGQGECAALLREAMAKKGG